MFDYFDCSFHYLFRPFTGQKNICIIFTFTIISIKQCLKQYLVIFSEIVCTQCQYFSLTVLHECMTASCITACAVLQFMPNCCAVCAYLHQSSKNAHMQTAKGLKCAREKSLAQYKLSSLGIIDLYAKILLHRFVNV